MQCDDRGYCSKAIKKIGKDYRGFNADMERALKLLGYRFCPDDKGGAGEARKAIASRDRSRHLLTLRGLVYMTRSCYLKSAGYMRCIHGIPN